MSDTTTETEDSNLVRHAEREMRLAGLYDDDADYGGMIPEAVLNVVRTFAADGHSGGSAMIVMHILEKVLRFEPLTPITSDPEQWNAVADLDDGGEMWQSKRDPRLFSDDGALTWYSVDEQPRRYYSEQFPHGDDEHSVTFDDDGLILANWLADHITNPDSPLFDYQPPDEVISAMDNLRGLS